ANMAACIVNVHTFELNIDRLPIVDRSITLDSTTLRIERDLEESNPRRCIRNPRSDQQRVCRRLSPNALFGTVDPPAFTDACCACLYSARHPTAIRFAVRNSKNALSSKQRRNTTLPLFAVASRCKQCREQWLIEYVRTALQSLA
ncbi:MAG: hypothetical protein RML32_05175, partial [Gammaproteobacteria bacterium]|nr:hypothetical protein [Gammaproteobacteria bacterium]